MTQKMIDDEIERLKNLGFSQIEAEVCTVVSFCMDYDSNEADDGCDLPQPR